MLRYNEDEKYRIAKNSVFISPKLIPRKLQFSAIFGDPQNFNASKIPCLTVPSYIPISSLWFDSVITVIIPSVSHTGGIWSTVELWPAHVKGQTMQDYGRVELPLCLLTGADGSE